MNNLLDNQETTTTATLPVTEPVNSTTQKAGVIFPLRVSENIIEIRDENDKLIENRHVNLLLTEKEGNYHYSTITSFSRLVRMQVSKHHGKHFFCYRCLHGFIRQDLLDNHVELCKNVTAQRITMPSEKDNILKFTNIQKQLPAYFRVYTDFESIL